MIWAAVAGIGFGLFQSTNRAALRGLPSPLLGRQLGRITSAVVAGSALVVAGALVLIAGP